MGAHYKMYFGNLISHMFYQINYRYGDGLVLSEALVLIDFRS